MVVICFLPYSSIKMRTQPVGIAPFKDLGNPSFTVNTPSHHISLNGIVLCVAKKQSGKTRFVSNLLYQLKQASCMDRIFCLSDTFDSNKKMMESLNIRPEDVLSPNDPQAVQKIIAEIEKERDDLLVYREKLKRWKAFNHSLDKYLLEFFDPVTRQFEPPKHWLNGRKPVVGIFADDIQSSSLIGSKAFKNLCIKCRHIGAFQSGEAPIGCSIFVCVQNYTASGNEGIPKSIRGNINCCACWKSGNWKEIDLLATELSGVIPKHQILQAYDYVMNKEPDNRHNFLFIDLTPKKEHLSPFRMNYTEWLIPDLS